RYDWLKSLEEVRGRGRKFGAEQPGRFEAEVERGRPDDVAFICYTSGTTGDPKGAMLTHGNAVETARIAAGAEEFRVDDDYLAYLPMAWVGDAFYTLIMSLYVGFACNCPESPETVQRDLRELGPTLVLAPPRIWENILTGVQVKAADAPWLKRRVFEAFRAAAERAEILRGDGKPVPLGLRLAVALGEVFVYGPVRPPLGPPPARSSTGRVGSTRATPASSTRAGTSSSSTGPRTSARWPTGRRSLPSSSRTSSSSAPTSARRSRSAVSARSSRR